MIKKTMSLYVLAAGAGLWIGIGCSAAPAEKTTPAGTAAAGPSANLVKNSDMENGIASWMLYGTVPGTESSVPMISVATEKPHGGKSALQVRDSWDRGCPCAVQRITLPKDGRFLTLQGYVRLDRARRFRFGLLFARQEGDTERIVRRQYREFYGAAAWRKFELPPVAIPEGAAVAYVMLAPTSDNLADIGTAWFDDIQLNVYNGLPPRELFALDRKPVSQVEFPPTPADGSVVNVDPPSFALLPPRGWDADQCRFTLEYARTPDFKDAERVTGLDRCMYIPKKLLGPGKWFWRYGVETPRDGVVWSQTRQFTVAKDALDDLWPDLDSAIARIPKKHPRLYVTPDMVPEIRRRALSGPLKTVVDDLKRWVDAKVVGKPLVPEPPYLPSNVSAAERRKAYTKIFLATRPDHDKMQSCALLYLLTGDKKYGEEVRRRVKYFFIDWDPEGSTSLYNNDEPAMVVMRRGVRAYDWAYDMFTPEERVRIERSIAIRAKQNYDVLRRRPMDSNPYESHSANGYLMVLGEAAVALLPEHPEMKEYLDYMLTIFRTAMPIYGTPDGGWNEGPGYWSYVIERLFGFIAVTRQALGIDLMKKPFFRNTGYYPMIGWPAQSRQTSFGDRQDPLSQALMLRLCAVMTGNADFLKPAREFKLTKLPQSVWAVALDRFTPPESDLGRLPKAWLFEGIGFVAMRTDLRDFSKDVGLLFQCNPFGSVSHNHNAQNCFLLEAYGEPLAISSGYYDFYESPHHRGWTRETKAGNGITYDGGKGQIRGGQAAGRITRFETNADFDIVVGDAKNAYPGFSRAERTIVHVRPGFFVIRDRVKGAAPHVFEYNLHSFQAGAFDEAAQTVTLKALKAECLVKFFAAKPWKFRSFDKFPIPPVLRKERPSPDQWHFVAASPDKEDALELITVLLPYRTGEEDKLPTVGKLADGVCFSYADGHAVTVRFVGDEVLTERK